MSPDTHSLLAGAHLGGFGGGYIGFKAGAVLGLGGDLLVPFGVGGGALLGAIGGYAGGIHLVDRLVG